MKKAASLLYAILAASIYTSSAQASCTDGTGCLQVPGDFANPINHFSMYLLGGGFHVDTFYDFPGDPSWYGLGSSAPLNTAGKQIDFTATQFNNVGSGQGTSILSANFNHYEIGSAMFLGSLATMYIDGAATGTLVDNATSTQGHWTLNTHLYGDWAGTYGIDLGIVSLSTDASFIYAADGTTCSLIWGDVCSTETGNIMDYHSGLAYMVGQGIIQGGPFPGLRVTYALQGQDPVAAPVPVPTAAWLLGSGLIGLAGFTRKRKIT